MPSSRYGTVLSKAEKRSNTSIKVYKLSSLFEDIEISDLYSFVYSGNVLYPGSDTILMDSNITELLPVGGFNE